MDYNPTPSLTSILATLSAYGPPPTPYQTLQPPPPIHHPPPPDLEEEYHPPPAATPQPPPQPSHPPTTTAPHPPLPPTSSITTWPPALRHTLLLARNPSTIPRIQHLIAEQHSHERTWWRGREEMVRKQRGRGEARGRLDGVLKGLGGHVAASTWLSDPDADARELERYDRKVYVACGEMMKATERELEGLGVPFFGVRMDGGVKGRKEGERDEGRIGEEELQGLRKRMLELLEDLCKD